jgi:hypothetical protein
MTKTDSESTDIIAALAFISGAVVIVASLGSMVLSLLAVAGIAF